MSDTVLSRRGLLILGLAAPLRASGSDFWNKKPPAAWTAEEIERLLHDSPWAKTITPNYTSLPERTDNRTWSENPPIIWGKQKKISVKVPYHAVVRWESADPVRDAQSARLPVALGGYHVIGLFFAGDVARDLGSKTVEDLEQSAALSGKRAVAAEIVQVYRGITDGFLIGFPKTAAAGAKQIEFSARAGLLEVKAKFDTGGMRYHGQLAL